ncbi:MAG: GspH/FimT family pseudopilin [Planctomycetota bacterium]
MRSDRRPTAFTLVELLLVLALVVVLAAFVAPSLTGTLARVRLDAAAEEVRTAWADARLEAMRSGTPMAFQCRLGTGEYSISPLAGAAVANEQQALADDEFDDLGGVRFEQLSLGTTADPSVDPAIAACLVFRPNGATDDAFAVLRADDGRQRRISLRGLTCAATIDHGSPPVGP